MNHPEPCAVKSVADCGRREAELDQLIVGYQSVLPAGKDRKAILPLDRTWVVEVMLYVI
jgi:hypothetical protein